jgi:hypothetical protein
MSLLDLDKANTERARALARALSPDVDLDDDTDVARDLYAHNFSNADFDDVLPAVIDLARIERRVWA